MTQLNPYLMFKGNCREAMTFYQACLGGELKLQTVGESPTASQLPPEASQNIIHSTLTNANLVLQGSDMMGPEERITGNAISLTLDCSSEEEIRTFFEKLSAGGQVSYPLKTEFWGGMFGILTDKYGIVWFFNYEKK